MLRTLGAIYVSAIFMHTASLLNGPVSSFLAFQFHRMARQIWEPGRSESQADLRARQIWEMGTPLEWAQATHKHTEFPCWLNFLIYKLNSIFLVLPIFQQLGFDIHKDYLISSSKEFYRVVILTLILQRRNPGLTGVKLFHQNQVTSKWRIRIKN